MKNAYITYLKLVALSVVAALVLFALGYYPTVRLAGEGAIPSMAVGIAISLLASCVGSVPVALGTTTDASKSPQSILMATMLRFLVALALAAPALLSGFFIKGVLGIWIGFAYLVMLAIDTVYSVHLVDRNRGDFPC